jgi:hypothetical protein
MRKLFTVGVVLACASMARAVDVAQCTIVLPAKASAAEKRAADELRTHLKQMAGVEPPLSTDDQPKPHGAILLGASNTHLKPLNVTLDPAKLGEEGFLLRTVGDDVIVAGAGPRGTLYGATTLLEKLGVRWFTPSITRVPNRKTIPLDALDEIQLPAFEYRQPYIKEALDKNWAARLKTNGQFSGLDDSTGGAIVYGEFVHTFDKLVPPELFSTHPEYFPLINGKRENGYVQRCLTNSDVLKLTIETVRRWMKNSPNATIFSVSQNDCFKFCECDACKAIEEKFGGKHSGVYLWFVNQVAEAVEKEFPDKLIDTLAYQFTEAAPAGIKPRKNVRVRLCPMIVCESHLYESCQHEPTVKFAARLHKWASLTDALYIWHYNTNFTHYLAPFPDFRQFPDSIRLYQRMGVKGVFFQGSYSSLGGAEAELRAYVMAKLAWDPTLDADALVTEWMKGVYGEPAAGPMRKWFDLLHERFARPGNHLHVHADSILAYLTPDLMTQGAALMDEAEKHAAGDAAAIKQIARERLCIRYVQIVTTRAKGPELDQFVADAKALGVNAPSEMNDLDGWARQLRN